MSTRQNRREFMELTSAGLLVASTLETAHAALKSANDKLVVGLIGCGGRGVHDAGLFRKTTNVEVAYVSDVDDNRRASSFSRFASVVFPAVVNATPST